MTYQRAERMQTATETAEQREEMRQTAREVMAAQKTGMVAEMMRAAAMEEIAR